MTLRPITLTSSAAGMSRMRTRGGANPDTLYDLLNGWVNPAKAATSRFGTTFLTTLPANTKGLCTFGGQLHVFTSGTGTDVITYPTIAAPALGALAGSTTGGTLAANTYYYKVTAYDTSKESVGSNELSVVLTTSTSSVNVTWGAVTGAAGYNVYRGTASGKENRIYSTTATNLIDTGYSPTTQVPPTQPFFAIDILRHPSASFTGQLSYIHFASPFLGYLYVVAEFDNGDVFHYWLRNPQKWMANKQYQLNDIIQPNTANGFYYQAIAATNPKSWAPHVPRAVGDIVQPTVPNGFKYTVTATNGSGPASGGTEPSWPAIDTATVVEFTQANDPAPPPSAPPPTTPDPTSGQYANPGGSGSGGSGGGAGSRFQNPGTRIE